MRSLTTDLELLTKPPLKPHVFVNFKCFFEAKWPLFVSYKNNVEFMNLATNFRIKIPMPILMGTLGLAKGTL